MKAGDLIVPTVVVVGGYVVVVHVLKLIPDPLKSIQDFIGGFGGLFTKKIGIFTLSRDSARQGQSIGIAAAELLPNTGIIYGWKEIPASRQQFTTTANGEWYGPGDILITAPVGTYHIYLDQRPWNGGYGEREFRVLP
jgi:hypothetical protein